MGHGSCVGARLFWVSILCEAVMRIRLCGCVLQLLSSTGCYNSSPQTEGGRPNHSCAQAVQGFKVPSKNSSGREQHFRPIQSLRRTK